MSCLIRALSAVLTDRTSCATALGVPFERAVGGESNQSVTKNLLNENRALMPIGLDRTSHVSGSGDLDAHGVDKRAG